MTHAYPDIDATTRTALNLGRDELVARLGPKLRLFADNDTLIADLANAILSEYQTLKVGGRESVAMIVPVGPVGQYQLIAQQCNSQGISLADLTLIVMDEYLTDAGEWIPEDDPLSFRSHLQRHLMNPLPENQRPNLVVPHPERPQEIGEVIAQSGGLDVTFAGVGITGHLAFNDPIPGIDDADYFADLPTRVVPLLPETRLINSVTAARGNLARIPRLAVTVGMREIRGARKLRIYMNRDWQSAAIRRLAFGPVTASFPASLVQNHPDWTISALDGVLQLPEPELK